MNWAEHEYKTIKRLEKAMSLQPKNINRMKPTDIIKYYDKLVEMKDKWEEKYQQELKY
jgi:DNA-binding ferritin-like protein (Dps family)